MKTSQLIPILLSALRLQNDMHETEERLLFGVPIQSFNNGNETRFLTNCRMLVFTSFFDAKEIKQI
jgi:hypothetical protein